MINLLTGFVIVAGIILRTLGIRRPLLGNFAIYQTAQAMIAKAFIEGHFTTILYPTVNDLAAGRPALLLLYYPVSSFIAAVSFFFLGGSLDVWGRLQAIVFFGGASFYLFLLVRSLLSEKLGLASVIAFSLSPLTIIYGQSFQNEMATTFFTALFFYQFLCFLRTGRHRNAILAALSLSGMLVTRPNCLYIIFPMFWLCLVERKSGESFWKSLMRSGWVLIAGSILPAFWYFHTWRVSNEASNIYSTLFAQLEVRSSFLSTLALQSDYYRMLFDILNGVVLTPIGFTLLVLGCLIAVQDVHKYGFFLIWSLSFLMSSLLIPRKLIDHNFYLLHLVLPASSLMGVAFQEMTSSLRRNREQWSRFTSLFLAVCFFVSMRYAFHPAFKTSRGDEHILRIADKLKDLTTRSESRVVVQGTHALLYYADRYGWPFTIERTGEISDYLKFTNWEKLSQKEWEERKEAFKEATSSLEYLRTHGGATHFVVTDPADFYRHSGFAEFVLKKYELVYEKKGVCLIFKLNPNQIQPRLTAV